MSIDFAELELELRRMERGSKLYELLKRELMRRGNWKARPRGKPFAEGHDSRRKSS
jgi:hypothetical protein